MNLTLKDAYKAYKVAGGTLPYEVYREACVKFNEECARQIVDEGRVLNMGANLSTLQVIILKNKFKSPRINWQETEKRKKEIIEAGGTPYNKDSAPEGEKYFVYHLENDWYPMFYWNKSTALTPNKTAYRFTPSGGAKGVKTRLIQRLKKNPLARRVYDSQ